MSLCVTVTHHEPESAAWLRADVFHVDACGQVDDRPVRSQELPPGGSAIVHLQRGHVLVVRELPQAAAGDADAQECA